MRRSILLVCTLLLACDPDPDDKVVDSVDTEPAEVNQDEDGDGVELEDDCDDQDAAVFPGAAELCDGLDNDCDGVVDDDPSDAPSWYADLDGDGYGDLNGAVTACEAPAGLVAEGGDCDDTAPLVNPGAAEVCDGLDNNCDGLADGEDAEDAATYHLDGDGDGYGDATKTLRACEAPEGAVSDATDCDDDDDDVNPGATERCSTEEDDDCDGLVNEDDAIDAGLWYADADLDGFGDPTASFTACEQLGGAVANNEDCDDGDFGVNPDATEVCDGLDNNCDGSTDGADAADRSTWYTDADLDGFGDPATATLACDAPKGAVSDGDDCDDGDDDVNPDASELCDSVDNNCDGGVDEGTSGSGSSCAALSCLDVLASGETTSGVYTLDPDDDGDTSNAVEAYCDLDTDGGGWTLVSWTGDSTKSPLGVPYPGLAVCSTLDCQRGSSASEGVLEALIRVSTSFGVGHSTTAKASFDLLGDYDYAVSYNYTSLAGFTLSAGSTVSSCVGFATGTADVLAGPTTADGATVYLAQGFYYASSYGTYSESSTYIWLVSAPTAYCNGSGSAPGAWLCNWSASEREYGPYLANTAGARSVWVR